MFTKTRDKTSIRKYSNIFRDMMMYFYKNERLNKYSKNSFVYLDESHSGISNFYLQKRERDR